jgi:hypothetical protein
MHWLIGLCWPVPFRPSLDEPNGADKDGVADLLADDLEAELLGECDRGLQVVLLLPGRSIGRSGGHPALLEHSLDASGREDDERTRVLGLDLERLRDAPRLPDPGAGTGDELVVSHAEADPPLDHIHDFFFAGMDVERRPVPLVVEGSLQSAEGTAGVAGAPSSMSTNRGRDTKPGCR